MQRNLTQFDAKSLGIVQRGVTHQVVVIIVESAVLFCVAVAVVVVLMLCNTSPAVKEIGCNVVSTHTPPLSLRCLSCGILTDPLLPLLLTLSLFLYSSYLSRVSLQR